MSKILPLQVEHLKKSYGSFHAVRDLSFEVKPGEIFGLLGPNGAGKTTTISIVTTLEKRTSGSVLVFGEDVESDPKRAKFHFGVVHQEVVNSGFFDVEELLYFQSGYYGLRQNGKRIQDLLGRLGLYEHRHKKVKQLSGGMKRRLMIAKALVHHPKLLLLDEPTAGVDLTLRENLWNFVKELRAEGIAVLLTTHYLEEAELLCDRVGIIHHGRLEACGLTSEIVSQFSQKKVTLYTQSLGTKEICAGADQTLEEILSREGIDPRQLIDVHIEEGRLEEAFKRVISGPREGQR